jgi:transcriptional regulator with XRE-family HTH domain
VSTENVAVRFGKRLRYLREKAGMSQGDLSHNFGIDRGHVSDLENGKKKVGLSMLETLADGFGITISELMKGV